MINNYYLYNIYHLGKAASPDCIIPTITPNKPNALPNIYITKIFTKVYGVCASLKAHPLPVIPTHTPHTKLEKPTDIPVQNNAYPSKSFYCEIVYELPYAIFPCMIIAIITP